MENSERKSEKVSTRKTRFSYLTRLVVLGLDCPNTRIKLLPEERLKKTQLPIEFKNVFVPKTV